MKTEQEIGTNPASDKDTRESLIRLTNDMDRMGKGDLTVRASVKDNIARPVAESLNKTVQKIGELVGYCQSTATQMSSCVSQVQSKAEKLSQDSNYQADQMNLTSATVDEIVESIRQVAEHTSASAQVAEEARRTATTGSQSVSNTIKGMERIRKQVQSTSKRIKQLGETSQQIGEIVQLISDVADRSSLLALNASIQAAMAGDAGQGFGVVAEEVERLSKRCNVATKQIATLVKSIQSDTSQAIAGMEESIAEVVNGSKLASQAGEALADIDSVSNRLAELTDSISVAVKQQVRGGVLASRSIIEISAITQDNAGGIKQASEAINELATFAEALRSAVGCFSLPPQPDREVVQPTTIIASPAAAKPPSSGRLLPESVVATAVADNAPLMF
jgi:twitching motility protein PilJ